MSTWRRSLRLLRCVGNRSNLVRNDKFQWRWWWKISVNEILCGFWAHEVANFSLWRSEIQEIRRISTCTWFDTSVLESSRLLWWFRSNPNFAIYDHFDAPKQSQNKPDMKCHDFMERFIPTLRIYNPKTRLQKAQKASFWQFLETHDFYSGSERTKIASGARKNHSGHWINP